jgi:hypothetical protein
MVPGAGEDLLGISTNFALPFDLTSEVCFLFLSGNLFYSASFFCVSVFSVRLCAPDIRNLNLRISDIPQFRNAIPQSRNSAIPQILNSAIPQFHKTAKPHFRISTNPDFFPQIFFL